MPMYGYGYNNPYMYGGGMYPTYNNYYGGGGGMYGGYGGGYYNPYGAAGYYGYRSPGLLRSMYNRLRYGSTYYYPEMGLIGGAAAAGRYPYERDFSSTKNVWRRSIY
ncbi:hypothetical protein BJ944DRAFT_251926 [Cunninghamella echinulata]|nr:hypothetical protein BJ944DRAFT_251926 [Cunninghamella echinulata]